MAAAETLENSIDLNNLAHMIAAEMLQNHLAQQMQQQSDPQAAFNFMPM